MQLVLYVCLIAGCQDGAIYTNFVRFFTLGIAKINVLLLLQREILLVNFDENNVLGNTLGDFSHVIWSHCLTAAKAKGKKHRNLRTRRRMHLCMQDDQICPKILGFAPADLARLPTSIIPTKSFEQ
jgi:hypothetical protein